MGEPTMWRFSIDFSFKNDLIKKVNVNLFVERGVAIMACVLESNEGE
jgi:hypothetical protein